jgi:hypothetical protein
MGKVRRTDNVSARLVELGAESQEQGLMADPGNRWTPEEDALFRSMAEASTRPEMIAAKLNRSVHAVGARACAIGLPLKWFT